MAALLAVAAEPAPEIPYVSLTSEGSLLIYGRDEKMQTLRQCPARQRDFPCSIVEKEGHAPNLARAGDDFQSARDFRSRKRTIAICLYLIHGH